MFTGIVEERGEVRTATSHRLVVGCRTVPAGSDVGASVAVNGVCLTVVEHAVNGLIFEVGPETLRRTALNGLREGRQVNLERALRFGGTLGGHLVLGHVDGVATVERVERVESTARVRIALRDRELAPLLIPQGSVAVDGVSLTVAALEIATFEVMVIPHTLAVTTFGRLAEGETVNVEMDVIGKYLQRSLALRGAP
jgi:riboflavin synthase